MLSHIKNVHEKNPELPKKITGGKCKFCPQVRIDSCFCFSLHMYFRTNLPTDS
jgi:hypothetical protein